MMVFLLFGCMQNKKEDVENETKQETMDIKEDTTMINDDIQLMIDDEIVEVQWEINESTDALKQLIKDNPLTIDMSMYGGFEQVGSIGTSLPKNDVQMTTVFGDIVLYSGNQLVLFYGSNSWAYTKLGKMLADKSELQRLLGNGDVKVTLSLS